MKKIEREKVIVREMIKMYAQSKTGEKELKGHYKDLADYCELRLENCHWGEKKPVCKVCPIHCYGKEKRAEIRKVMRWAGPRMLLRHPILTLKHYLSR